MPVARNGQVCEAFRCLGPLQMNGIVRKCWMNRPRGPSFFICVRGLIKNIISPGCNLSKIGGSGFRHGSNRRIRSDVVVEMMTLSSRPQKRH